MNHENKVVHVVRLHSQSSSTNPTDDFFTQKNFLVNFL
jgi:hypothetical protein